MTNRFNCSEAELFLGLGMIGRSLEEHLAAFGGLKGMYDAGFVAAYKAKVAEAEALPSESQRVARVMALRIELREMVLGGLDMKMGFLRSYIRDAFKVKGERAVRLEEAGFGELKVAKQMNWEVVKGVMKKAMRFMEVHGAVLMANMNMPAGFAAEFGVMAEEISGAIDMYLRKRMELKVLRQQKVRACNEVYRMAMMICADGKVLFKRNPAVLRRFTWKDVMGLVTPPGAARLRGEVKRKGSFEVMEGVEVRLEHAERVAIVAMTDVEGRFDIGNVPGAGVWRLLVIEQGVVVLEDEVRLQTGVRSFRRLLVEGGVS